MRLGLPWDPRRQAQKQNKKKKINGFDKSDGFDREVYQL